MKSYWKSIFVFLFTFSTLPASAQEVCDNGTDDDGDGLIDCFDSDCATNRACDDFFFGNSVSCSDDVDVTTFAVREQWGSDDETATSHVTPAVGDLDGNGIPEVVSVNNYGTLDLFVLNGATGQTLASTDIGFIPENAPVIAKIDGDEIGDIIVSQDKGDNLALYNFDPVLGTLTQKWRQRASVDQPIGLPGVADFDEDGDVEIYYRNEVMDALTGTVIVAGDGNWEQDYTHGPIAADILPDAACDDCAGLELISGNEIWAINEAAGTRTLVEDMDDVIHTDIDPNLNYYPKYFPNWDDQWSSVSVADYNLDGNIDVIMSGALGTATEEYKGETTIFFWDVANSNVITYHDPTNNFVRGPGRINIGDVDGDGQPNANFVMNQKLYSLDENFNIHWIHPIREETSGFTGCSLFDFDGDGAVEVVYRSEESLLIVDGVGNGDNTTSERREIACVSRTQEEYPVIADVDGDGSSEICVSCYFNNNTKYSPYSNTQFSQIRVYESDGEAWMPARGVWNQHGYYNVNINDDLTIPTEVQDPSVVFSSGQCQYADGTQIPFLSRPINTFINQAPILNENGCVEFISPDINFVGILSATDAQCPDAEITVDFQITNIGDTDISGNLPVSYYAGDPRTANSTLLDTEVTLLVGFEVNDTLTINQTIYGVGGNFELFVVINDNGGTPPLTVPLPTSTIPECETRNNIQSTLVGFQTFDLTVEKIKDNGKCDSTVPDNGRARAYYFGGTPPASNETIWLENFEDRTIGDDSDTGTTAWTSSQGSQSPFYRGVDTYKGSKMFRAAGTGGSGSVTDNGMVTWTSQSIDISNHTDISISVGMFEDGMLEPSGKLRDFYQAFYSVDGGANVPLSNGSEFGNFTYLQASAAGINGNSLTIIVQIRNNNRFGKENHYIDNVLVTGTGLGTVRPFTEPDGFVFNWYNDDDYSKIIYTGSQYPQMATGTYDVVGYFAATECYSDTVELTINLVSTPSFNVHVYEVAPLTDCNTPNGSLSAFAYTTEVGGIPQDTLRTADGYGFTWFIRAEGVTSIGAGDVMSNLDAIGYAVEVREDLTGCTVSKSKNVSSSLTSPPDPSVNITDITNCNGTGQLAANVGGNTADYTFEWYDGPSIKPAADFTGDTYTVPDPGDYTVVATLNSSGCLSNPVTVILNDNSSASNPTVTLVQNNTSCVAGNGIVSADGNGLGNVTDFTFEWFQGANTLPANALPGTAAPGAFLVSDNPHELGGLEQGTYTVRVTDTATSCFETRTIDVTDTSGSLAVDDTQLVKVNINSCNPAVLGSIDASLVVPGNVNTVSLGNINSDFEFPDITQPPYSKNTIAMIDQTEVPGWSTTAVERVIELWRDGFNGVPAYSGDQFAEILARSIGALYFDLSTVPGSLLSWTFAHRGRDGVDHRDRGGVDNIRVSIGAVGSEVRQGDFATGSTNWELYSGSYTVPADQFVTRFQFESLDPGGVGNFVDSVTFVLTPYRFELFSGTVPAGTPQEVNTSGLFSNLDDGNYVLAVYNNLTGCAAAGIPIEITRSQEQPLIDTDVTDDDHCDNDVGSVDVTASMPGAEPASYTYEIFNGHSFTTRRGADETIANGATPFTFSNLPPGDYRIRVTNDDIQCTNFTDIIVDDITVIPAFSASQTINDNTSCNPASPNGFLSVSIQGDAESNYNFSWWNGTNTSVPADFGPTVGGNPTNGNSLSGLAAGDYTVIAENTSTGCETVGLTLTVANNPYIPDIVIIEDAPQTDCGTGNGILSAYVDNNPDFPPGTNDITGFSFQWQLDGVNLVNGIAAANGSVPGGIETATVSGLVADEYTLIVTHDDPSGSQTTCTATRSFVLSENQAIPTVSLDNIQPNTSCNPANSDGEIHVNLEFNGSNVANPSTNGFTFRWFDAGNTLITDGVLISGSSTEKIIGLGSGAYKVVAVSALACASDTLFVNVGESLVLPTATEDATGTNDNTVCDPALTFPAVSYNGQITVTVGIGTAADYTFTWFKGTSTAPADVLNDDANDGGGGTSAIAGTDTTSTGTSIILSNIPGGTYTLQLNSTVAGCSDTFEFDIVDTSANLSFTNPAVDITTGDQTVCGNGTDAYPDGSITITEANINGSGNYSYRYYSGGLVNENNRIDDADDIFTQKGTAGAGPAQNVSGSGTNSISGLDAGTYTVVVLDLGSGCISTAEVVRISSTPPTPPVVVDTEKDNSVCDFASIGDYDGFIRLRTTDASNLTDYTYQWFRGQSTSPANAITASQVLTADISTAGQLNEIPSGTYTVLITDPATGCTLTIEETIGDDFTDPVVVASNIDNLDVCEGNAAYPNGGVNITSVTGGSGNYSFEWYYGSTVNPANLLDNADDIFTQKGIAGTVAVNVSGSTTATIGGLNPGSYTVRILDTDRGCYSDPSVFVVGEDPSGLSLGAFTSIVDNYSCDLTSPTGSATANGSGATTPRYEWYAGTSATGSTVALTQTATGLSGGIYTVKYIDDATNCFVTAQITLDDYQVILTPATSNVAQTNCAPPNGEVSVDNTAVSFNPAGPPRGWPGEPLTYQWYFGFGTGSPMTDLTDPGNGSNPLGTASNNMTRLTAGTYTVVVTDTVSGCTSTTVTEVVADGISANAPDLDFNPTLIPNACTGTGSFEVRMLTNPSGNNFTFEFYEGTQDYANNNSPGDGLATNDQLASNPGQNIAVTTVTESTAGGSFNNFIMDVVSGPYTVVVTDQTTGCRYQEFYNFPFLDQQTTTTITVENVDGCLDRGVAKVGLQEDGGNGFMDGEEDDISEYVLYLYAGAGIPAERESPYTFGGIRFPLKYDAAGGLIRDGDDKVYANADESTPMLNLDDNAEFHGLPAGPYIAVAREIPKPAFNNTSTTECWSGVSFGQEIIDLAHEPLIDDVTTTPNSICDEGTFGGNGQISVTVVEDPAENANAAEFQQPAGYTYSLRNSSNVQVDTMHATGNETETFTTPGLVPDDYTVRIWRAFRTFNIGYAPASGTFLAGETIDFSGGDVGVITTGGVGAGTLNVYITTGGTPAATETITGRGSGATGTVNTNVAGAVVANGCSTQEVHTISNDPATHTVVNASTVDYENCDAAPSSTITINDNDIEIEGVGQPAANYNYQWFKGTPANDITVNVGIGNSIDLSASGLTPIADTYFVVATSIVDGCITPPFQIEINDNTVDIQVSVSVNTVDNSCVTTDDDGAGIIDFSITAPTTGTYSYAWFTDDLLTTPVAGTATGISGMLSGPYVGQLSGVNGGQNYYLRIIDTQDPNDACSTVSTIFLDEVIAPVELLTTDYTTQEDNSCAVDNGFIEISSVNGAALTSGPANYTFRWYETSVISPNEITGSAINANTGEGNRVEDLATNTYFVEVTEVATSCVTVTEVEIFIDEILANPTIELASLTDNTFCASSGTGDGAIDIDVTFAGLNPVNTDDFDYVWYRGDATNVGVADQEIFPTPGANAGTAMINGVNEKNLINLSSDTYTVVVTDSTDPYNACSSTAEFVIADDLPVIEIRLADITTMPDNNCGTANPNGTIDIAQIFVDGTPTALSADWQFNWTGLNAGATVSANGDEVTDVVPGTYTVIVTKQSTNQCASGSVSVTVEEETINPTIELMSSTASTFCAPAEAGDGTLVIDVTFAGLNPANTDNFEYVWYRGDVSSAGNAAQEIYPVPGANAGTAMINGVNEKNLINLSADTYSVVVTDNTDPYNSCSSTATYTINSDVVTPTLDEAAIQARTEPNTLCTGTSGTLVINDIDVSTGDLTDFEVRIYTGAAGVGELPQSPHTGIAATSISYTNLAANDYFITAQNRTTGCSAATAVINVSDSIRNPQAALISMTPDQDCGGGANTGGLQVLIDSQFDETDHFDVQWFTGFGSVGGTEIVGANSVILSNVASGPYSVTVTNQNTDCSTSRDYTITNVPINPSISNFIVGENTICDDDNDNVPVDAGTFELIEATFDGITLNQAAMAGLYRLEVYEDFLLTSPVIDGDGDNTNFIYTQLSSRNYFAIVRKLDSDCISEPVEFDVVDDALRPIVSIELQVADSTCAGGGIPNGTLRATAAFGAASGIDDSDLDYSFEWFTGSGAMPGNSLGLTTSTITGRAAGTYSVQVTRESTGCVSVEDFELPNVQANVEITTIAVVDATNCAPGDGTITVTAVSRDNVTDYNYDYYNQDPALGVAGIVFTGNAGVAHTTAPAGTYWVIGTNTLVGCTTPAFEVVVGENLTLPSIALGSFDLQTNCDPGNPNGSLLTLANGQPENATYDFEWFFGMDTSNPLTSDDYTGGGNLTGANTNEVSGIAAGFYTVQVTSNTTGCASTETFEMADDIPNPIVISMSTSPNTHCINPNGKMAISVIDRTDPSTGLPRPLTDWSYYWFIGDLATVGTSPDPANADFTGSLIENLMDGDYVAFVIDQTDNFCQSQAVQVTVGDATSNPEYTTLTTSDATVCFDDKDGYASVDVPDLSTVDIAWFDDTNAMIDTTFFVDSLDAGMYRLRLTDVINGCISEENFEILNNAVIPNDPFVIVNNGRNNCQISNGSAIANVDGVTNNFLFEWFDPIDMETPYATGSEVFNLDSITYLVRATDITTGCQSAFTSVDIRHEVVDPEYEVIFNNSVCLRTEDGSTNQFTGTAIINFAEFQLATDYEWRDAGGTVVGNDSRLIDAYPGDYTVTFTAENGCSYSASFSIETSLTIYNGVSANADGKNDFFLIDCIDYFPNNNVQIFNRAGQKIYDIDGYNNTSIRFEGFSNVGGGGLKLPSGTYFYIVDLGAGEDPVQGFLELVR